LIAFFLSVNFLKTKFSKNFCCGIALAVYFGGCHTAVLACCTRFFLLMFGAIVCTFFTFAVKALYSKSCNKQQSKYLKKALSAVLFPFFLVRGRGEGKSEVQ